MEETNKSNQLKELINNAVRIAVVPARTAGIDGYAAGAGIFYILKDLDKSVSLIYPGEVPEKAMNLVAEDQLVKEIEKRELVVSVDYSGTPAAKVSYDNSTPGLLYLRFSPVDKNFDVQKNVRAGIGGQDFDVMVTIGAPVLRDLGRAYNELDLELSKAKIINIDNTDMNHRYGRVNIVDAKKDSLSLLVLNTLTNAGYTISSRGAKALLTGIASKELK